MGPKKNNRNKNKNNNSNNNNIKQSKEENTPPTLITTTVSVESSNSSPEISSNNINNVVVEQTVVINNSSSSDENSKVLEKKEVDQQLPIEDEFKVLESVKQPIISKEELESSLSSLLIEEESKEEQQKQQQQQEKQPNQQEQPKQKEEFKNNNNNIKSTPNITDIFKNELNNNSNKQEEIKTNEEWKQLYFLISKQLNLERIKCETLEGLIIQKDKENQHLHEQVHKLENELINERRRINKTIGTTKFQTRKLLSTVKFDHNIDIASIIDDLNNIDSSISQSPSFADDLQSASISNSASNSFTEFNSDQLLNKLNNYHNSTSSLVNAPLSANSNYSSSSVNVIAKDQNSLLTTSAERSNGVVNNNQLNTSNSSNGSIGVIGGPIRLSASNNSINSLVSNSSRPINISNPLKEDVDKVIVVQSLVRKWLSRKRYKKLRTKRAIVEELFETESTYVSHLSNLIKIFINPLKAKKGDSILPSDEFDSIFSRIVDIYNINSTFLDRVDEIFKKFNKWACFGELLLKQVPTFYDCYIDYIINYEYKLKNLKRAMSSYSSFSNFVKQGNTKRELDDLDLEDLLIMPVQRIPRYVMLLYQIRKFTPLYHDDFNAIDKTLEAFKQLAELINKKSGARKLVLQLDDRVLNYKDDLLSNSRILIREGPIKYKKNQEYSFLFNDMILICHPTHSKKVKKSLLTPNSSSGNTSNNSNNTSNGSNSTNGNNNEKDKKDNESKSPIAPSSPVLKDSNGAPHFNSLMETSFSSTTSNTSNSSSTSTPVHEFHSSNLDINFKFLARYTLDARVKIIQDLTDPKFTVLVPDVYSIDFYAPSMEERQIWVQEINKIVSTFANNINLLQNHQE